MRPHRQPLPAPRETLWPEWPLGFVSGWPGISSISRGMGVAPEGLSFEGQLVQAASRPHSLLLGPHACPRRGPGWCIPVSTVTRMDDRTQKKRDSKQRKHAQPQGNEKGASVLHPLIRRNLC